MAINAARTAALPIDVLVVGAGQAGLIAARALLARGLSCVIHERHARVGDAWRKRFDSLRLFTSRECSALPGLAHDGDPNAFPTKDEQATYLERYAGHFDLPVVTGDGARRLEREPGRASFVATTDSGRVVRASAVVVATGAFQVPRVPSFARALSARVVQLDASTYRNAADLAAERVLVAGDGATGRQIALELAASRRVVLATGRRRHIVPARIAGKDSTWWFDRFGLLTADKDTRLGRFVRARDSIPGLSLRSAALRRAGIAIAPRAVAASDDELVLADGSRARCDAVIWTLGYRDETSWLSVPDSARDGRFVQERGITPTPGLFHVGREWQSCRASALLLGVHRDAERIARRVEDHLGRSRHARGAEVHRAASTVTQPSRS